MKWALGVAGLVSVGVVILMLTENDVRKAVLLLVIVLVGMLLVMIVAGRFPGPRKTLVWSITVAAIASLFMTVSAYAFGCPEKWAQLVGAQPQCSLFTAANSGSQESSVVAQRAVNLLPVSTAHAQDVQVFRISESSPNCAVRKTVAKEYCTSRDVRPENIRVEVQSANCGSKIGEPEVIRGRPNCISIPVTLRGCGYDQFLGLRNCRGRGWVAGEVSVRQ